MQPARDPQDIRYWPRSEGGQGFRNPNDQRPSRQYSALRTYDEHGNLTDDHTPTSIVTALPVTRDYTPDTIRSRARAVLALALSRVESTLADEANELKLNELAPTMAALGRISGVQTDDRPDGVVTIRIVRDQLTAQPDTRILASVCKEVDDAHADDVTADVPSSYGDDGEPAR